MLREADASIGDYYTEKEFRKLSKERRAEYCAELARQDSVYKAEMLSLGEELDQSRARSRTLRAEGDSLFAQGSALEAKAGALAGSRPRGGDGRGDRASRSTRVVKAGDSLWRISRAGDVYGRGSSWRAIYDANRARIQDPNLIYPGQELSIPR